MIKVEELRVGNYVIINNEKAYSGLKGIPFKVIGINKKERYSIQLSNNEYYEYNHFIESIQPIKLTEELLLKCGFEKNDKITITNPFTILLRNDKYLSISDIDNCNQMAWIYSMECGVISDLICIHNFDYDGFMPLHKLQNIYYLFSNKELEINL